MDNLAALALIIFASAASLADIRSRRIPNWLTIWGALAPLALVGLGGGRLGDSLAGVGAGLAVGLLLFQLRLLGAGDAKFMAAVGAWAGWHRLPAAYLGMLAGGAAVAIVWSVRHRILRATLVSTSTIVGSAVSSGARIQPVMGGTAVGKFPYAIGLALGAVAWWFWAGGTLP